MGEERVDVHVAEGRLAGVALAEVGTTGAEQHVHVAVRRVEAVRAGYGAVVLARDEADVAEHHDDAYPLFPVMEERGGDMKLPGLLPGKIGNDIFMDVVQVCLFSTSYDTDDLTCVSTDS